MDEEKAGGGAGREYRAFAAPVACRSEGEAQAVEGVAANWEPYRLWGRWWERVAGPEAFEGCDMSDVVLRYDHEGKVMARTSNGTLAVSVTPDGLAVSADLSRSRAARDMFEEIRAGLVTRMSWAFTVSEEHEEKTYGDGGEVERVTRVIDRVRKVYDVAPVSIPANDKTSISARAWADGAIGRERMRSDILRKRTLAILAIERTRT
ncbi:MAG: HK97 family phage prohead protease [Coriobacteriales bacterium]|jgi:HK97 family phage prohead protease|nr:HK97 family phage prohead protease [Coriobacteriales bacterium]